MKKRVTKIKAKGVAKRRKKTSPYAQAVEEFDPYNPTIIHTETHNTGETIVTEVDARTGIWNRLWRWIWA